MVSSAKTSNLTVWVAWAFSQQGCILVLPMCRPATGVEKCCAHDLWDAWKSVNWELGSMLLTLREWYFSILFLGVVATYLCTWSCPLHSFFQQWQAQWDSLAECRWGDTQTVSSSRTSPKSFEIRSGPHMLHSHANTRKGYHGLPVQLRIRVVLEFQRQNLVTVHDILAQRHPENCATFASQHIDSCGLAARAWNSTLFGMVSNGQSINGELGVPKFSVFYHTFPNSHRNSGFTNA